MAGRQASTREKQQAVRQRGGNSCRLEKIQKKGQHSSRLHHKCGTSASKASLPRITNNACHEPQPTRCAPLMLENRSPLQA